MKKVLQKWINGSKDLHLYQGLIMMSVLRQCRWLVILIDNLIDFEKLKKNEYFQFKSGHNLTKIFYDEEILLFLTNEYELSNIYHKKKALIAYLSKSYTFKKRIC